MLYEIDMLRYTARTLLDGDLHTDMNRWVCLEAFLVHFRNLIEFFGNPRPRGDDLHVKRVDVFWPDPASRPTDLQLQKLVRIDLWENYETNTAQRISRYLHHCTEERTARKDWDIAAMFNDVKDVVEAFEKLLPDLARSWDIPVHAMVVRRVLGPSSGSTATEVK